jgi:hypothetical protein
MSSRLERIGLVLAVIAILVLIGVSIAALGVS